MEFAGAPFVLIGQADQVAYTTTTALLRTVETFFEHDHQRERGRPALQRRRHAGAALVAHRDLPRRRRRPARHVALARARRQRRLAAGASTSSATRAARRAAAAPTTLDADGAFDAGFTGGYIAIVAGTAAGEIRHIAAVVGDDRIELDAAGAVDGRAHAPVRVRRRAPGQRDHRRRRQTHRSGWRRRPASSASACSSAPSDSCRSSAGARLIPSTHNFLAADNKRFNGNGTDLGNGNIGYWASGFSRIRSNGGDPRLPTDGSQPNPFVVVARHGGGRGADDADGERGGVRGTDHARAAGELPLRSSARTGARVHRHDHRRPRLQADPPHRLERRQHAHHRVSVGRRAGAGDTFEVYAIVGMPEAVNPAEGYLANWNNKAATADEGNNFGRLWRHLFILERLAPENAWDRAQAAPAQRGSSPGSTARATSAASCCRDCAQAVNGVGSGGNPAVETVLSRLEAQQAAPESRPLLHRRGARHDHGRRGGVPQPARQQAGAGHLRRRIRRRRSGAERQPRAEHRAARHRHRRRRSAQRLSAGVQRRLLQRRRLARRTARQLLGAGDARHSSRWRRGRRARTGIRSRRCCRR